MKYKNYMVSTEMTTDRLLPPIYHSTYSAPKWFIETSTARTVTTTESVGVVWSSLVALVSIICLSSFGRKRRKK